jgi:hypothetical protein
MRDDELKDADAAPGEEHEDGERTMESKLAAKRSPAKEPKSVEPGTGESPPEELANIEENYPGITEQIRRFVATELPSCPYCGSEATASVQVGLTGRASAIAAATTKVKLVPHAKDKLGAYFCSACGKYFN